LGLSLELPDVDDDDCRLTRTEIWRSALFALGGVLVFIGIGFVELLLLDYLG
jgi:hypothetical protein